MLDEEDQDDLIDSETETSDKPLDTKDMRQIIRERMKQRQKNRNQKKSKQSQSTTYKASTANTKLMDYDLLPKEEQDKYFGSDGSCLFQEMTGEASFPQFIIDRAFDLYFEGLTLEAIAAKWNIKLATVANWHRKQSWEAKIEKFKEKVDSQYEKEKVKEVVSKRKEIDDRHESTLKWLWMELQWEMNKPYPAEAQANDKAQLNFEMRRNLRMKTWQITINCYKSLIDTERVITGMDQPENNDKQLPTDFNFTLSLPEGTSLNGIEDLRSILPSQDPFSYNLKSSSENAPLALTDGSETPQLSNSIPDFSKNNFTPAEPIPNGERVKPIPPVVINPVVIPRLGMNTTPPLNQHAPAPHPIFGYLDMGGNKGF
jgi:hypothetical protein